MTASERKAQLAETPVGSDLVAGAKGLAKSVLGTIQGGGRLLRAVPVVGPALESLPDVPMPWAGPPLAEANTQPSNRAQQVGKTVGNVAQFFAPAAALAKAKAVLATGRGVLDALVAAGLEGGSAAAIGSAQKGSTEGALTTGLVTAGTGLAVQGAIRGAQVGLGALSDRVEAAVLKPSKGASEGLTPAQLVQIMRKYEAGGTLSESYEKVTDKITMLASALKGLLRQASAQGVTVNLGAVSDQTAKGFLDNPDALKGLEAVRRHLALVLNGKGVDVSSGVLDLADANLAKQAAGELTAWTHDLSGQIMGADATVVQTMANRFYGHLKTAIEQGATQAPGQVRALNNAMSDLIPLQRVIVERIPAVQRSNILTTADILSVLSPKAAGIGLLARALRSGTGVELMHQASQVDPAVAARAAASTGRLVGAVEAR